MDLFTDLTDLAQTFPLMRGGRALLGPADPGIPYRVSWVTGGALKIAAGSAMVWLTY
ncbi:hypothetical protein [Kribbella turkmenica]|uniref:hypothetical protein n=1 Tax=Kribbella turkmenica TaxID=2530375 RepID=UPI001404BE4F|nr:hypothetical protein [Kribbella turkmenica]